MENRAYSVLQIRSIDEEKREISGWATTPTLDRVGDIIEPMGVTVRGVVPLLLQHDHDRPVGSVKFGAPTPKGVPFVATLPVVMEAGVLRDRVDEAWQTVKYGIITAVSVGFRILKDGMEQIADGGWRFTKTELLELSLVSVPANHDAVITAIKKFDREHLPSAGHGVSLDVPPTAIAVAPIKAAPRGPVKLIPRNR